jgi:hypothetical protein
MGLPTEEDLTRLEEELFGHDDDPPATWMRSV